MLNTNHVQLIGRIGNDIELKITEKGDKILKLSVATSETFKSKNNELTTSTTWHDCVAFGSTAEHLSKYLKKGSRAVFQGSLLNSKYEDKNKVVHYNVQIKITEVYFTDSQK